MTCSAPLSGPQSSRWILRVTMSASTEAGGRTWGTPDFVDHGPKPSTSNRSRTAMTMSWWKPRLQLAFGDLSNRITRLSIGVSESRAVMSERTLGELTRRRSAGASVSALRRPPLEWSGHKAAMVVASPRSIRPGTSAKPFASSCVRMAPAPINRHPAPRASAPRPARPCSPCPPRSRPDGTRGRRHRPRRRRRECWCNCSGS